MRVLSILALMITFTLLGACGGGGSSSNPSPSTTPQPSGPRTNNMKSFIFGHSLIVHATPSDETTVPHWLAAFAEASQLGYTADGQYGFLRDHAQLPPRPQWTFQEAAGSWSTNESQSFAQVGFDTIMLTPANFIQYQSHTAPYYDDPNTSPFDATLTILDWVTAQAPDAQIYVYENWPDMGPWSVSFPPTANELAEYHAHTLSSNHSWWLDYHDDILSSRPALNVRLIPVASIMADLLTSPPLNDIPVNSLYEDDAPHGRASIYFLAALVTYMATYADVAPVNFNAPSTIHPLIRDNYNDIVTRIWNALNQFEDGSGNSRVF